ncbi:unnamed protein product, partial [Cuscuta epithymum]
MINGTHFMLETGEPYYRNGYNAYWLMTVASDINHRNRVTALFQQASDHNLFLARTWAFSDGGDQALQSSPGVYNETIFQGLDNVISMAGYHRQKLILSLVNNFNEYGGKAQYVAWANERGQSLSSDDDFFTNSVVKEYYKNHIKTVLTRKNTITGTAYKDDSTIMAWELMNEPRCPSDASGKNLQNWIKEMAAYVKSIDNKHLLQVGLEGFYGPSNAEKNQGVTSGSQFGTDFIANNQIPEIDFTTAHAYADVWLNGTSDEDQLSFLRKWIDIHIEDAQNILKKPMILSEFGKSKTDPGFTVAKRDKLMNTVYSDIYSSAKGGGAAAGSLFWQLFPEGMESYQDGYAIVFSESPTTADIINHQSSKLSK